jgi:acetyl-CoA carboxylase biotin carboxylase subunit
MARALREYQVLGIRTTIPFFLWLMRQPGYRAGQYDTTFLDRLLEERQGESFSELAEDEEELAAVAVAVDAFLRAGAGLGEVSETGAQRRWKQAARHEALRG